MATVLSKQTKIVNNAINNWLNALGQYGTQLDNSAPISITYYKISSEASRQDYALENVRDLIGNSSPIKYIKIKNVPAYNLVLPEINRARTDRGIEAQVNGDFLLTPLIKFKPVEDEFFVIETDGLEDTSLSEHIFKIVDVQYDKMTSNKYFKLSYQLSTEPADVIDVNVVKTMILNINADGTSSLVDETTAASNDNINSMADTLIDEYKNLFYNDGIDTFEYFDKTSNTHFWCPYLIHFMYSNNVLDKSSKGFLDEIYIADINQYEYPFCYNEESYRNSIYYAIQVNDYTTMDFNSSFASASMFNLNMPYTLPFYTSPEPYKLIEFYNSEEPELFYLGAFHLLFGKPTKTLSQTSDYYKYLDLEDYVDSEKSEELKPFECIYQITESDKIKPIDVKYIATTTGDVIDADMQSLIEKSDVDELDDQYLFTIIKEYFANTFTASSDVLTKINRYYYKKNIQNYLLMPIVIYILKQSISK